MLLRDFRNFIAVAETRSLSRAALRAHLAQPALSRQIHELERELGVPLLERHSKGVTPTAAGQAFARGAANLLVTLGFAIARAEATSEGRRGRVSIGAMLTIIAAGIPGTVEERLHQEDPEITLAVEDLDPPDTVEQVRAGAIDIALTMAADDDPDLLSEPLWDEYLDHIILPHGHPLAGRRRLKLSELGEYPLVIPQRALAPGVLDEIMAVLRKGGLRSPLLVIDVGLRDGHLAVSAGRGWSLIGRTRSVSPPQGTAVVAIADAAPRFARPPSGDGTTSVRSSGGCSSASSRRFAITRTPACAASRTSRRSLRRGRPGRRRWARCRRSWKSVMFARCSRSPPRRPSGAPRCAWASRSRLCRASSKSSNTPSACRSWSGPPGVCT